MNPHRADSHRTERADGGRPSPAAGERLDCRRRLLAAERRLEAGIGGALAGGAECPGGVWERAEREARLLRNGAGECAMAPLADLAAAADLPGCTAAGCRANRLIGQTSPYLLQHAHNPVDWRPWGPEAFAEARRRDRPVFLSIGYSTCHWCHVMAHESFEDERVARILNERFVSVKVDREERPDVDEIYMTAVQLATGGGGWPLSAILTPARDPFFTGTYFPRDDAPGRAGFVTVLNAAADAYASRREEVERAAGRLAEAVRHLLAASDGDGVIDRSPIDAALERLRGEFDAEHGGFGEAPKFPPHGELKLLLREYGRRRDDALLRMATATLDAMAAGGMRDHVGGGFHRYATDRRWLVPHFEKMLYDNAQILAAYAEAHALTGSERYRRVAEEIASWLGREMTSPGGGFHAALDADSGGVEGAYYVWTYDEIARELGGARAEAFARAYGATRDGSFLDEATGRPTGANILHLPRGANTRGVGADDVPAVEGEFGPALARLREVRAARERPGVDDKILAGWNGLAISALARAGRLLDRPAFTDAALAAARFVVGSMIDGGRLARSYRAGATGGEGYLDDYACLADAALELRAATGDQRWLATARSLADVMMARFADADRGGFFRASDDHERLLARSKDSYDGATPSGNGVAVSVLARLAALTGEGAYAEAARRTLAAYAGSLARVPGAMTSMLVGLGEYLDVLDTGGV